MQQVLREEQKKNSQLTAHVNELKSDIEKLKKKPNSKSEEIEKMKNLIEAKDEWHASTADELRFQIQSLRNKLDMKTNIENGTVSPRKNKQIKDISGKGRLRKNSDDSSGSTSSVPGLISHSYPPQKGEYIWRINAFTKKLKKIQSGGYDDPSRSEAFTTGQYGYRLSVWAYLNGRGKGESNCLSVYIRVMAGEFDPVLPWPIKPCYTFYLLSQDPDPNKRMDLVRVRDLSIKHSGISRPLKDDKSIIVGFDDFIIHEDIEQKNYLMDDSLFLKVVVEVPPA